MSNDVITAHTSQTLMLARARQKTQALEARLKDTQAKLKEAQDEQDLLLHHVCETALKANGS